MSTQKPFFSRLFGKTDKPSSDTAEVLACPVSGKVIPIEMVADQTFSQKILGDGLAIEPAEGMIYSPSDGVVSALMDTNHALGITSAKGAEILIHVGRDTVELGGKYFTAHTREGMAVKQGELLLTFDLEGIRAAGFDTTTPIVVSNSQDFDMEKAGPGAIAKGEALLTLRPKN